jgi:hypothetical protein
MAVRPAVLQALLRPRIVAATERRLTCDLCRRAPAVHLDEARPAAVCGRCRKRHATGTRLVSLAR